MGETVCLHARLQMGFLEDNWMTHRRASGHVLLWVFFPGEHQQRACRLS